MSVTPFTQRLIQQHDPRARHQTPDAGGPYIQRRLEPLGVQAGQDVAHFTSLARSLVGRDAATVAGFPRPALIAPGARIDVRA